MSVHASRISLIKVTALASLVFTKTAFTNAKRYLIADFNVPITDYLFTVIPNSVTETVPCKTRKEHYDITSEVFNTTFISRVVNYYSASSISVS